MSAETSKEQMSINMYLYLKRYKKILNFFNTIPFPIQYRYLVVLYRVLVPFPID